MIALTIGRSLLFSSNPACNDHEKLILIIYMCLTLINIEAFVCCISAVQSFKHAHRRKILFHQVGNTIESLLKGSVSQKCIETGPFNNVSIVFHP